MTDGGRPTESCMKHSSKNRNLPVAYGVGGLLLLLSVLTGLLLGATAVDPAELWGALRAGDWQDPTLRILRYVRLPRVWGAVICGAALAVSGAVIQNVLCNHLASPSIIGVNAGAGLSVTVCSALGIFGGWRLSLASFLGAFCAVMLVSLAARRWSASRGTVILIGVALNSLLGAVTETVTTLSPDVGVMTTHFRAGDFSAVTLSELIPGTAVILVAFLVLLTLSERLEVLTLGEETARSLGMRTGGTRALFLLLAALLAGAAVSVCGLLSFVGLLVPHAVRRTAGSATRHLLPLCALYGGGFVALCDTLSRVLFSPYEVPVGILFAFLGAPFFVFILIRGKGGVHHA